jgi:hypothetical protein
LGTTTAGFFPPLGKLFSFEAIPMFQKILHNRLQMYYYVFTHVSFILQQKYNAIPESYGNA